MSQRHCTEGAGEQTVQLKEQQGEASHLTRDHLHGNKYADIPPYDVSFYRGGRKQHTDTYVTCLW